MGQRAPWARDEEGDDFQASFNSQKEAASEAT